MEAPEKSIVVVLGAHRSGTSSIARSLQILGVELGERLMAPTPGVNEKGFYEDIDLNRINIELLRELDQDWHTLTLVSPAALQDERIDPLRIQASALLKSRISKADVFGFKDPRICRLLPFWQHIFKELQLNASYVISIRNPISVANSMQRIHGLPPEKTHYLWLEHVLPSIQLTKCYPRVVVDYDRMLADPEKQVRRIAKALRFDKRFDPDRLAEFQRNFLDKNLRKAFAEAKDVFEDPGIPKPVKSAFKVLKDIAGDRRSLNSNSSAKTFDALSTEMEGMAQALGYLDRLDNIIIVQNEAVSQKDSHIEALSQVLGERDCRINSLLCNLNDQAARADALTRVAEARDDRIESLIHDLEEQEVRASKLGQELAQRDGRIESLIHDLEEQEVRASTLGQELAQRDGRIESLIHDLEKQKARAFALGQELAHRDGRIESLIDDLKQQEARASTLGQELAEREGRIETLDLEIEEKDKVIQQVGVRAVEINHRLRKAGSSFGWRLLKSARMLRVFLQDLRKSTPVELLPFNEIETADSGWISTGFDPQFLILSERSWTDLAGWWWMNIEQNSDQPMEAQLFIDAGNGFDPSLVINLRLSGKGRQQIPIYIPLRCNSIRLDPCDKPATFSLSLRGLKKMKQAPDLRAEFSSQAAAYESLGAVSGSDLVLTPLKGIKHCGKDGYPWESVEEDPWFGLKGFKDKLNPGWYSIEYSIRANVTRGTAKLYFDFGEGYSEWASVALPFRSDGTVMRIYWLPATPRKIRMDPIEQPAKFSVRRIQFVAIESEIARDQMLKRVVEKAAQYKDLSEEGILRDLEKRSDLEKTSVSKLLYEVYNHTFRVESGQTTIVQEYEDWIAKVEAPELACLDPSREIREGLKLKPTISVVMPVYNTEINFLERAIESVIGQSYPHWELCIADDASTAPKVREILESYKKRDPRINVIFRRKNGHISEASNSALGLATGEFVALLDHDDELAEHALFFVALAINRRPSANIIYSDEDKIDEQGRRIDPHFKPDWSPDSFFSQNYISHLGVYRRELIDKIGGFRVGVEGCQDHDLLLRSLTYVTSKDIVHIPRVLYHWRVVIGSAALGHGEKRYTSEVGIKVLQDYFSAHGFDSIKVESGLVPNTYRVCYSMPRPEPMVSILIPTRDKLEFLETCVRSVLENTTYQNYEVLILNNNSVEPETLEYFERIEVDDSRVRVLPYRHPFNFSAINNYGVKHARGQVVGLVNNDIEVITPEWLTEMVSHALRPEIGCVGAKLYYPDDTIQHAGVIVGLGGVAGHSHKYFPRDSSGYFYRLKVIQNMSAVTAACLVVRKSIYEQVGGLDETGLGIAFNDVDFCLKVREAGFRNLWTPYAELYHHESKSRGGEDTMEKLERFNREIAFIKNKWNSKLQLDPYYSCNLTLAREDFSLR